jgi:hypothetical protein
MFNFNFETWVREGFKRGWCGPPVCAIHDGLPSTEYEDEATDEGYDPCLHVLRLYESVSDKKLVELNHAPSRWRASNRWDGE